MTREELRSLGWTDEELTKRFVSLTGPSIAISSSSEDTPLVQSWRRVRFDRVLAEDMAPSPPMRTTGPKIGSFAKDDPALHASYASKQSGSL